MKLFSTSIHSGNLMAQPDCSAGISPLTAYWVKALLQFRYKMPAVGAGFLNSSRSGTFAMVLLFSFLGCFAKAQISSTPSGGNWNSGTTWVGGVVPGSGTTVTIVGGATVTVDVATATCASLLIGNNNNSAALLGFNNTGILKVIGNVEVGSNGNAQRTGSINMTNGGTLKIGAACIVTNLGTFTRGTGTIEYDASGIQTASTALGTYQNLKLSGSGAKSIVTGTIIAGNLSITGATASIGAGLNISVGTLTLGGISQVGGTWGSTTSASVNKNDTYFAATNGIISVVTASPVASFSSLTTSTSITYGTSTVTLSGTLSGSGPTYPVNGETVSVTINGVTQNAVISGGTGGFSINFPTSLLNVASGPYTITYAYAGGANLLPAVNNTSTSLTVTPASLTVTANDISKSFGTAYRFKSTDFKVVGLLNGNTVTSVSLSSSGSPTSAPISGNPYPILISNAAGSFIAANYSITYVEGVLTVTGINQSIANYRSRANGNFSAASTWEFEQLVNDWANATLPPTSGSNITILHDVTLDQNHTAGASKTFLLGTAGSLTINPGINLDVALNGTIDFNGKPVVVKSTAAGTGSIGKILGTLIGETNITAERYIGGNKRAWRLLTIPVTGNTIRQAWAAGVAPNPAAPSGEIAGTGTLITGHNYTDGPTAAAAGYDWFTGLGSISTSSIRSYSLSAAWASSSNTPNPTVAPGKEGYLLYIRGDRTVASSSGTGNTTLKPFGTMKKGNQIIPVNELYTVIGNPYASAINLDSMYTNTGNSSVIARTFYVWDATLGTSGAYRTLSWNGFTYDMSGGSGIAADYLVVNSGQAFFVEQLSNGSITIGENNKTTVTAPQLFRPVGTRSTGVSNLNISLFQATGNVLGSQADRVIARYNGIYNESPSETFDAAKLNNLNENLSLVRNNKYLSIESRPFPTRNDTLHVPFWNLNQRSYAFEITSSKFIGINQTARLIDGFTKTETFLEMNDGAIVYPFTVTSDPASSSLSRFKIVMAPATVLAVNCTKFNAALIGKKVELTWSTGCEVGAADFVIEKSADGVKFNQLEKVAAKNIATGASYQLFDGQPYNGKNFYRIRSNDKAGHFTYTSIVLIQLNAKKGMQVIPTVIDNKRFTIMLNQQATGKYNLMLTNAAGQQVYQSSITNRGGNSTFGIELGNISIGKGVYTLSVVDAYGNNENFKLLINN